MCGIAGYYAPDSPRDDARAALAMLGAIAHRGPDDQGFAFLNTRTGAQLDSATRASAPEIRNALPSADSGEAFAHDLAFAHCRYSIVDLTPAGHQPMWNASRQACVSFNGEIYNYVELRQELEQAGLRFRTRSDTEVLLAGYLHWGTEVFRRLNGQWALSLYDARAARLLLSRDRLGKVPLYFARLGGCLYWGSEIKAILAACGASNFPARTQAIDDYVTEGWRDRDGTFWEGIEDFPPASFAWVQPDATLKAEHYWRLPDVRLTVGDISPQEAATRVRDLLVDAIRIRVRADVPVAFELSGGTDSSSLTALAAQSLPGRVTTYTVEFADPRYDETPYARAVAERCGGKVDYRVLRPGADDFWRDADEFVKLEEEPFHAPNLHTNQSLRRQMRADGAKVVISGAAGDEVFAGYAGEYLAPFLLHLASRLRLPSLVREARSNTEYPLTLRNALLLAMDVVAPALKKALQSAHSGESRLLADCYVRPAGTKNRSALPRGFSERMRANMGAAKMNYWLRSANKSNFGIPIEPRAPFLDYRVVDFAFSLPPEYLIRDGWHKWILRKALGGLLPPEVLWRRTKMGFPFPIADWLAASRASVMANLADSDCPYLRSNRLDAHYEAFVRAAPYSLWRLISLGLWWRRVVRGRPLRAEAFR